MAEDAPHIWFCKGHDTALLWGEALIHLREWLTKNHTDPNITHLIISSLRRWKDGEEPSDTRVTLQDFYTKQELIGWHIFFEGWVSHDWASVQHTYHNFIHSRKTGRFWAIHSY